MRLRALLSVLLVTLSATSAPSWAKPVRPPVGKFTVPARPVWAGEIFDLGFTWHVDWQSFSYLEGPLEWKSDTLVTQPWEGPSQRILPRTRGGQPATISYRTTGLAVRPGQQVLPPPRQVMVFQTGVVRMSDYERALMNAHQAVGSAANLTVRALPPAPDGYTGGIGRFTLAAELAPRGIRVGERFTWTVILNGKGNWPALKQLPKRTVPSGFEVAGAPRLIETPGPTLFERSIREEVDLIARTAGNHIVGPVSMTIFDPDLGRYTELRTAALPIEVIERQQSSSAARVGGTGGQVKDGFGKALPPFLVGSSTVQPPLAKSKIWRAFALPPACLLLAWLFLAFLRSVRTDPERVVRKSHARIRRVLRRLSRARSEDERRRLVREWQQAVAGRLKLSQAAPIPESFSGDPQCQRLWEETELFLYGRTGALPPDWSERAFRYWTEQGSPPSFAPASMFLRRNLLPLCLLLAITPVGAAPASKSPVPAASALRQNSAVPPLDWKAHYNHAISLASAQRQDEAAAHAAVAWVQQPTSPATRALWLRLAGDAGYPIGGEGAVPRPSGWLGQTASAASPRLWQQFLIGSWSLLAAGMLFVLILLFYRRRRRLLLAAVSVSAVGLSGAAVSWAALSQYGALASLEAAIVWETVPLRDLPVETPVEAGAAVAGAGLMGRVDGAFLNWRRVDFGNGKKGWVRQSALIHVWGASRTIRNRQ